MPYHLLKTINIITTAAYPWQTGTAILALLRAYYLGLRGLDVTLYVPWVNPEKQGPMFGTDIRFSSPKDQEVCIRNYLPGPECPSLTIDFYPGAYVASLGSVLPLCQLSKRMRHCDWLILEEPEHLNWFHPWNRYQRRAPKVTGIVMTNYLYYWNHSLPRFPIVPKLMNAYNRWLIRRHCDDILILTPQMDYLPGAQLLYSSGIHPSFFKTGPMAPSSQQAYFIGKIIWEKGFKELVDLLSVSPVKRVDLFGIGKDQEAIAAYGERKGITFRFKGITASPATDLKDYKIFLNLSRSEACCSTTAEALGQEKFVIVPQIPSNERYYKFKNCLSYQTPKEFAQCLDHALTHAPKKDEQIRELSWEAAVERLLHFYNDTEKSEGKISRRHSSS